MVFQFSSYYTLFIYIYDNYTKKKEKSINKKYIGRITEFVFLGCQWS
jgi:hypothetical protein